MTDLTILGNKVPLEFLVGKDPKAPLDKDALIAGAKTMVDLINSVTWPADYAAAFRGMKKIVFFEGKIVVNGWEIDRPCCDEDDAIFYWEAEEFLRNPESDVRANTYFHDCWHVVQFKEAGNKFAGDENERVHREVDAINHQIEVAKLLGNDAREIGFLENFRDDQNRIKIRLAEGVTDRMTHTPGTLRA